MKTKSKIIISTAALAAVIGIAAVGTTHAGYRSSHHVSSWGGHSDRQDMLFERFDANQDGKITKLEIDARRKQTMDKNDTDKSGDLSLGEFQGVFNEIMRQRMVRMFQRLDRNGDAKVTENEIARRLDRMMGWLDRDEDGVIKKDEIRSHKIHGDRGHQGGHRRG